MCVGERRKLVVPSGLAFGDVGGFGSEGVRIKPGATLVYDVQLLEILDEDAAAPYLIWGLWSGTEQLRNLDREWFELRKRAVITRWLINERWKETRHCSKANTSSFAKVVTYWSINLRSLSWKPPWAEMCFVEIHPPPDKPDLVTFREHLISWKTCDMLLQKPQM